MYRSLSFGPTLSPPSSALARPYTVGLVVLIGLLPALRVVPGLNPFDGQRVIELAVLTGLGLWAGVSGAGAELWFRIERPARWGVLAVLGLGAVSAVTAPLPGAAVLEVIHLALVAVGALVLAEGLRKMGSGATPVVVASVVLGSALALAGALVAYAMHLAGVGTPLFPHAGLVFTHVRHFNQIQTWTLPLLALPVLAARSRTMRALAFGLLAGSWMLLLASGGRASLLGMLAGMVGVAVLLGRRAWPWVRVQAGGAAVGGVLYGVLFFVVAHETEGIASRIGGGMSDRDRLWAVALDAIRDHPWLGVGPMHYAYRMPINASAHPHNQPLQWASEWGLPAALLLMGMVGWAAWKGLKRMRAEHDAQRMPVAVALGAVWIGVAVVALFDGIFVMPVSQLFAVLIGGWTLAWAAQGSESPPKPKQVARWRGACAMLAAALLAAAWPGVAHLQARNDAYQACLASGAETAGGLYPRFWQVGYLGDWTVTCSP